MTYFSLRKRDPEPEPEEVDGETEEETEDEPDGEQLAADRSSILAGLLGPGAWLAARFGVGTAWGAHIVAAWAIGFYRGWTAAGIVLVWLLAVLAFVPREHLERLASQIEGRDAGRTPDESAPETTDEAPVDPLVAVMWKLIAGAPGVHLKTLAERLQRAAPEEGIDRAAVRAKLAALGIPVKASVRDAAGRVNEGVHRADLQAWEEALPDHSSKAPSEVRSSPVGTAVTCDVANAPTAVATPLSRVRRLLSRGVA